MGRYTRQAFTVIKSGVNGESASDDIADPRGELAGQDRLPMELSQHGPEVLLLMEGTNDLFWFPNQTGVTLALQALERMIEIAQSREVTVFIATIPPQRENGIRDRTEVARLIPEFNARLKDMAIAKGARVVDVNAAMSADLNRYIGPDDLHPTQEGLRLIGETFYQAIRTHLDSTPGGTLTSRR